MTGQSSLCSGLRLARQGLYGVWLLALLPCAGHAAGGQAQPTTPLAPSARLQVLEQDPEPATSFTAAPAAASKSIYWGALLSIAVPGLGEYYAGHPRRALVFGALEGSIWTSFITFKVQEDLRRDRSREFAVAVAGANTAGDDAYFEAIGRFPRNDGPGMWNEFVRRRARDTHEVVGVEYFGDDSWAWPSNEQLAAYRSLRRRMLEAEDNATNMIAVAFVNRVLSAIDVVQAMRSGRNPHDPEEQSGLGLRFGDVPGAPLASISIRSRF